MSGEMAEQDIDDAITYGVGEDDQETDREMDAILNMIKEAKGHNLLVEVVWSFGLARYAKQDSAKAAAYALDQWDI